MRTPGALRLQIGLLRCVQARKGGGYLLDCGFHRGSLFLRFTRPLRVIGSVCSASYFFLGSRLAKVHTDPSRAPEISVYTSVWLAALVEKKNERGCCFHFDAARLGHLVSHQPASRAQRITTNWHVGVSFYCIVLTIVHDEQNRERERASMRAFKEGPNNNVNLTPIVVSTLLVKTGVLPH